MLSPRDIRNLKNSLTKKRIGGGYDVVEVDQQLAMLAEKWEAVTDDRRQAEEKVSELEDKLKHYEKVELALQEALETARDTARRTEEAADRKARLIVEEAELRAQRIVQEAEQERYGLRQDLSSLTNRQNEVAARLRGFLMSELEILAQFQGDDPVGFIKLVSSQQSPEARTLESRPDPARLGSGGTRPDEDQKAAETDEPSRPLATPTQQEAPAQEASAPEAPEQQAPEQRGAREDAPMASTPDADTPAEQPHDVAGASRRAEPARPRRRKPTHRAPSPPLAHAPEADGAPAAPLPEEPLARRHDAEGPPEPLAFRGRGGPRGTRRRLGVLRAAGGRDTPCGAGVVLAGGRLRRQRRGPRPRRRPAARHRRLQRVEPALSRHRRGRVRPPRARRPSAKRSAASSTTSTEPPEAGSRRPLRPGQGFARRLLSRPHPSASGRRARTLSPL